MLRNLTGSRIWGKSVSLYPTLTTNRYTHSGVHNQEYSSHGVKVIVDGKFVHVSFPNQKSYKVYTTYLRDSSDGKLSIEPTSGQKLFTTASIMSQIPQSPVEIVDAESFKMTWSDGEQSTFTRAFFERNASPIARKQNRYFNDDVTHWGKKGTPSFPELVNYDYEAYMNNESVLADVVKDLNKFGFATVSNIPNYSDEVHDRDPIVKKIGQRIGYIKETFYGTVFDVRTKPNAKNIADTDIFLPLHQDLLYYESPPGLQLLHFIKNKSTGGENIFADGFAAAAYVKRVDKEAYQALLKYPINYHYDHKEHHYFQTRYLIVEADKDTSSRDDVFKEVNYSPPFQAPFDHGVVFETSNGQDTEPDKIFEDFLRGLKLFENYINDPVNNLKFKAEEGTCVLFDNRRVLHAREAFDASSSERWLKGTYLDRDTFQSKLRIVNK